MSKQEKLEEIYKASLSVFADYGFKKTTVEDIAQKLSMTKGALYLYAKDKKDLYEKSVAYAMTEWQNRVRKAVEEEQDIEKQFTTMCYKAFKYLSEDNELRKILARDPDIFPIFSIHDPYFDINSQSENILKTILERGIREKKFRDINPDSITNIMFTIYKMFIVETYIIDDETSEEVFDSLIKLITRGLFCNP